MLVLERSKITVWQLQLFKKLFCYWSFSYVSTLRKKVFSAALVNCFFLYRSNNSDSVVFGNNGFEEIKDHSLTRTPFQQKFFCMELLGMCLPYVKRYFQRHQYSAFFFMAHRTQILLFSGMLFLERSKIKFWLRQLSKKFFCYGSFRCVSTLRKKLFSGAPVKGFFLYCSSNSDSVVFGNTGFEDIKDHSLTTTHFQEFFLLWKFHACVCLTWKGIFSGTTEIVFSLRLK